MADALFNTKKYLPKCWIARIDKYWYPTMPVDYPATSTYFDFVTGEDKAAVIDMENNLNTENSIIAAEDVPEQEAVGKYLGTYDVIGEPGELALISPNKLPDEAVGALAYHYDSEADEWTKIEDVEIKDGYVYATLEEYSPIAVFGLKRAAYYDESKSQLPTNVLVCNGVPTRVYKDEEEDKIIANAGGVLFELAEGDSVVGGSYDGTPIESTNVFVKGVKLYYVVAGSWVHSKDNKKNHTKKAKATVVDSEVRVVTGAGIWNCVEDVEINVLNTKITSGLGNQMSFFQNNYSNPDLATSDLGLGANQWVKKSIINIKDSDVYCGYAAGSNGNSTTLDAELIAENTKFVYACDGQSNGTVYNVKSTFTNCEVDILNSNNRGHYGDGKTILNGGNIIHTGYVLGDISESDPQMADVRGKVSYDIAASDSIESFIVGGVSNVEVTDGETAAKYIDSIKISRDSNITYDRNSDRILKDIIRVK